MYGELDGITSVSWASDVDLIDNNRYEQGIIDRHSTPGLRRSELTRSAKRDHLMGQYKKTYSQAEIDEMLDKIYANA